MSHHTIGLFITNQADRRLLADFLRESGHRVYASDLGRVEPEYEEGASLVIADEHAARRYGRKLLDLKWRAGASFLPLLIVLPQKADSVPWLRAGFDDVLRHPLTKVELQARLEVFFRFRDQSEQYRVIFENALIGIYRCSPGARILMANPALVRMLGYDTFEELSGAASDSDELRLEPSRSAFRRCLEEAGRCVGVETTWRRRDGSALSVLESARLVRDERGGGLYLEGSVEDITERKRAEEERERLLDSERRARRETEEASRLKDEFLATVSHELRTPLTAVLGWTHILRTGRLKGDDAERALDTVERNARAQAQLIEDLLDVSRIITGKLRLDTRQVEPAAFIEPAVESVRPAAEAKGVRLRTVMRDEAGWVFGDPARLQQVVWNLLSNAVKFTPPGGHVEVRLERLNSHVEIAVSDTGAGISPEFLPYVFERFRQADGTSTRQHGGLGLGLAIVRHLVELHGGTVRAESEGEGRGATFTVKIPVAQARRESDEEQEQTGREAAVGPAAECPPQLHGVRVLVVDDERDTREMVETALRQCYAEVFAAGSTAEALGLLEVAKPDVLVSDIGMPGEDGLALIRRVRELPAARGGKVPAVALTAYARAEDRVRVLRAGYQMHVPKPVGVEELVTIVASLADRAAKD